MTRAWISALVWVGWAIYMFRGGPIWIVTLIEQAPWMKFSRRNS